MESFLPELSCQLPVIVQLYDFLLQIIDVTRSEEKPDGVITFADNLGEATVVGGDRRLAIARGLENSHGKSFVAAAWHDDEFRVVDKLSQFFLAEVSSEYNVVRYVPDIYIITLAIQFGITLILPASKPALISLRL